MTANQFRKLALSFPEAVEVAHMGHPDFRVGGRIFATLGYPDAASAVVMLAPEDQHVFVKLHPDVFAPVKGGWGKAGSTVIALRAARIALTRDALEMAWRRRAPKRLLKE